MKPGDLVTAKCGHAFSKWNGHELPDYIGTMGPNDIGLVLTTIVPDDTRQNAHAQMGACVMFRGVLGWISCKNLQVVR